MANSITENVILAVKTRLETIMTDSSYAYYGQLKSVQLREHKWEGGERPTVNNFSALPTIVVSDLGETADADTSHTWERRISIECWFVTDDGGLVSLIRAYEDMAKALNPIAFSSPAYPSIRLTRFTRSYIDSVTEQALDGVLLLLEGTYTTSMSDPTLET